MEGEREGREVGWAKKEGGRREGELHRGYGFPLLNTMATEIDVINGSIDMHTPTHTHTRLTAKACHQLCSSRMMAG